MATQPPTNISIIQNDLISTHKWQDRAPDTYSSQTIRSLDEFKAIFNSGSFRLAVQTNEGLLVYPAKIHKKNLHFQQ